MASCRKTAIIEGVKTVPIDELDPKTGQWLRETTRQPAPVVVTEQGKPIVTIIPTQAPGIGQSRFRDRKLLPEYRALMGRLASGKDSSQIISEDRDRLG